MAKNKYRKAKMKKELEEAFNSFARQNGMIHETDNGTPKRKRRKSKVDKVENHVKYQWDRCQLSRCVNN